MEIKAGMAGSDPHLLLPTRHPSQFIVWAASMVPKAAADRLLTFYNSPFLFLPLNSPIYPFLRNGGVVGYCLNSHSRRQSEDTVVTDRG